MAPKNDFETTILTVDSIKDFQTCALLYDLRHKQELREPLLKRDAIAVRFENTMKKIASFFFYKQQSGVIPSFSALVNRWERLWFPKDMTAYDIAVERHESAHDNLVSFSSVASAALQQFYEDFAEIEAHPMMIDEGFVVPVSRELRLQGSFDLVLRDFNKNEYKVIKWNATKRRRPLGSLVLDYAALKYAFDYRNDNKSLDVSYYMYDLGSSKPGFVDVQVQKEDVDALMYWAGSVHDTDVYAPRRGLTWYCSRCPFDNPCSEFVYPPIEMENA